jgi:hypothetical protein
MAERCRLLHPRRLRYVRISIEIASSCVRSRRREERVRAVSSAWCSTLSPFSWCALRLLHIHDYTPLACACSRPFTPLTHTAAAAAPMEAAAIPSQKGFTSASVLHLCQDSLKCGPHWRVQSGLCDKMKLGHLRKHFWWGSTPIVLIKPEFAVTFAFCHFCTLNLVVVFS